MPMRHASPLQPQVPPHHYDGRPIPVFGYNRREGFLDLVLPDFSWYGHEYSQLTGEAPARL
jgi:hypothetical protein